jgi:hypothetical protein
MPVEFHKRLHALSSDTPREALGCYPATVRSATHARQSQQRRISRKLTNKFAELAQKLTPLLPESLKLAQSQEELLVLSRSG